MYVQVVIQWNQGCLQKPGLTIVCRWSDIQIEKDMSRHFQSSTCHQVSCLLWSSSGTPEKIQNEVVHS